MTSRRLGSLLLLALLASCGPEPRCGLHACDIRRTSCQETAANAAACLLGRQPQQIPVTLVSRRQYVADELAAAQAGDVAAQQRRLDALVLVDLADPGVTPASATAALSGRVAAFYSPPDKRITIVTDDDDDTPIDGAASMSILVHESTHALQDAAGRLAYPPADGDRSYDRAMAQGALIEGEASLTETLTTLSLFGRRRSEVPWPSTFDLLHRLAVGLAAGSPVPVDLAYSYFAYPFGLSALYGVYATQGTAGIDQLWAKPPISTRQFIGARYAPWLTTPAPPIEDLGPRSMPDLAGFDFVDGDRTGPFVFQLFVLRAEYHHWRSSFTVHAFELSEGLGGDYLSLFSQADGSNRPAACWRLSFFSKYAAQSASEYLTSIAPTGEVPGQPAWQAFTIDTDVVVVSPNILELARGANWKAPPAPPPPAAAGTGASRARPICTRPLGSTLHIGAD